MRHWIIPIALLALAGCATGGNAPRSAPVRSADPAPSSWPATPAADTIISQDELLALVAGTDHQKVGRPYVVAGRTFTPYRDDDYDAVGIGSWYGPNFHGRPTANGEVFDQERMTAAHTTLPIPSIVEVTNLENGRQIRVRVNDRGPFVDDRIIDLSRAAARELGYLGAGLAQVRVRYIGPAAPIGAAPSTFISAPGALDAGSAVDDLIAARVIASRAQDTDPPGEYRLQLGAFQDRANAQAMVARLGPIATAWIEHDSGSARGLHRVYLGPWERRSEAEAERQRLRLEGVYDATIVSVD